VKPLSPAPAVPPPSRRVPRWAVTTAKIAVSCGLVGVLAWWADWRQMQVALAHARPGMLAAGLLVLAPVVPIAAWRWMRCARAAGVVLPYAFFARATYAASFGGQLLPAGVGMDALRTAYLLHRRVRLAVGLQSLLLDRVVGVVTLVAVMASGLPLIWADLPATLRLVALALIAGCICGLAAVWALDAGPVRRVVGTTGKRGWLLALGLSVRGSLLARPIAGAALASVAIYALNTLGVVWIADALGATLAYPRVLATVSMAVFVSLLPISVNGWGVREGAMVLGLSALRVPAATALTVSVLFGFGNLLAAVPGAFVWYMGRRLPVAEAAGEDIVPATSTSIAKECR
jgi:glycosyltransferase 2 family protein